MNLIAKPKGLVCVFGADGFLGHHVVALLAKHGWRVRACVRRPHSAGELRVMGRVGQIQIFQANIRYKKSIEAALDGCDAVVNLVGILYEKGRQTFTAVHEKGAANIASAAAQAGITNLVHISALGADIDAKSKYTRSKGAGEKAISATLPTADIIRPSILFGENDGFFTRFARLANMTPVLPLPGGGKTRFQPVYVADVAKAVTCRINEGANGQIYELGGPQTLTYRQLMAFVLRAIDKKRLLVYQPWFAMSILGRIGSVSAYLPLVKPFLTHDQVILLKSDNVASGEYKGLKDLGIRAETVEAVMIDALIPYRKYGQFHETITDIA